MSLAIAGLGVSLELLDLGGDPDEPESWRVVGELTTLKPPAFSRNTTDVTNMKEAVTAELVSPTLRIGPLTGTLNVVKGGDYATAAALLQDILNEPALVSGGLTYVPRPSGGGPEFGGGPTFHGGGGFGAPGQYGLISRHWRIALPPDGWPRWTFKARVQRFEPAEVGVDSALTVDFALTLTGGIEVQEDEE